jgi:predicted metal-dependent hydrolase
MPNIIRGLRSLLRQEPEQTPLAVDVEGLRLPVRFVKNARARRIVLRLSREEDCVVITVPRGSSQREGLDFARRSAAWIAEQLDRRPSRQTLGSGIVIPLRGTPHAVKPTGTRRGLIAIDAAQREILVPGDGRHVGRRLKDWLKQAARRDLEAASRKYAAAMGVSFRSITIRDQKSRWGSCSSSGELSYSWRLILTPAQVLDYVAAHEVAHLKHMNHGPRFWALVNAHCAHAEQARAWIRRNGSEVHRWV